MSTRIVIANGLIKTLGDDLTVSNQYCTHGNFTSDRSKLGLLQGLLHKLAVKLSLHIASYE
jgi:hypothetical protein